MTLAQIFMDWKCDRYFKITDPIIFYKNHKQISSSKNLFLKWIYYTGNCLCISDLKKDLFNIQQPAKVKIT